MKVTSYVIEDNVLSASGMAVQIDSTGVEKIARDTASADAHIPIVDIKRHVRVGDKVNVSVNSKLYQMFQFESEEEAQTFSLGLAAALRDFHADPIEEGDEPDGD